MVRVPIVKAIAFDQSLAGFGWAVLSDTGGGNLLRCGLWSTEREAVPGKVAEDNSRRFGYLGQRALELIEGERTSVDVDPIGDMVIYIEAVGVFADRFTTAIGQGRLLGIVEGLGLALRVPVIEVPTLEVKRLVMIGKRRKVEKSEVADEIFRAYPNARELVSAAVVGLTAKQAEKAALNITDSIAVGVAGMRKAKFTAQLSANDGSGW